MSLEEREKKDILEGKDIYLRAMTPEDTDLIVKWRNEDFVRRNFIYRKPFTRQGHLNWIETMVKTGRRNTEFLSGRKGRLAAGSEPRRQGWCCATLLRR